MILFIGDGMGEPEITLGRDYALGAAGRFAGLDSLTFTGDVTTYSVHETDPTKPDYVPDSAPTASAWATGLKSSNERISTLPGVFTPGNDPKTILELAQRRGYATGNVSTAEITDATPAALDSHVPIRGCQGPQDMAPVPGVQEVGRRTGIDRGADRRPRASTSCSAAARNRFTQLNDGGPYAGQSVIAAGAGARLPGRPEPRRHARGRQLEEAPRALQPSTMTTEWNGLLAAPSAPARSAATRPTGRPTSRRSRR